jgi:hypothetical protein
VGLDAFSVPRQGAGAGPAEQRRLSGGLRYTPDKHHTRYLVDFELDSLAEPSRAQAAALAVAAVQDLVAITAGGNGLQAALPRHWADNLPLVLDWDHAAAHVCNFAAVLHPEEAPVRSAWSAQAKGMLYEQGGEAVLKHLEKLPLPPRTRRAVKEELRKLIGYFAHNRHRTDYPSYRARLGDRQRPHEGGWQDHWRTLERLRHALGRGWGGHCGSLTSLVRQWQQTLGWLLGATETPGRVKSPQQKIHTQQRRVCL